MQLFYWGPLLFDKESGSTFFLTGGTNLNNLANSMREVQTPTMIPLAVVWNNTVTGQDLQGFGLELYDNLWTENYCVLKLVEHLDDAQGEGPGGLPEYPGAINLQISKENIAENFFGGHFDFSPMEISAAVYSTTAIYSEVLSWYKTEMHTLGWTKVYESENSESIWGIVNFLKGENGAMITTMGSPQGQLIVLVEGPTEMLGWASGPSEGPHGEEPQGGPFREPVATNEISFNHNPLFAFILMPVEFVQGLYGTALYGVLKLVIAIPLSVGLIGFLTGALPILVYRYRKWRKAPHKFRFFQR